MQHVLEGEKTQTFLLIGIIGRYFLVKIGHYSLGTVAAALSFRNNLQLWSDVALTAYTVLFICIPQEMKDWKMF